MDPNTIAPQDLVRKAVIEVAQLPENELLLVIEMVGELKKQRARPNRAAAQQLVAHAKERAAETSHLPRTELMQQFNAVLEEIRAEAVAKGTAIEGELESD
ncbi:MAG TPA: hypothetical protein VFR47_22155 [Anaerolineales bacterium]|nr:hypothetical protein [Anaerolineales bacterium]